MNITLIGMPGVGKSTLGVLLAKALGYAFLDTDVYLQAAEGRLLQEIIDAEGNAGFCALEERYILSLECTKSVIATGGSVVYSSRAMDHLRASGPSLWLDISLEQLAPRLEDLAARGVVLAPGQTLADLYAYRRPFYERNADLRVSCDDGEHETIVAAMLAAIAAWQQRAEARDG